MTTDEPIAIAVGDNESDVLRVIYSDSDGLLTGYTPYAVFDGMVRRELTDNKVTIPKNVMIGTKLRVQLMFVKDNMKFYSLNILTIRLNRVING